MQSILKINKVKMVESPRTYLLLYCPRMGHVGSAMKISSNRQILGLVTSISPLVSFGKKIRDMSMGIAIYFG